MSWEAFAQSFGSSLGGNIAGSILGKKDGPSLSRQNRMVLGQIQRGNELDLHNQKSMYDYRLRRGFENGMTPYEMFVGSSAGGAGGGTTGSGTVLGNAANQAAMQQAQLDQQAELQMQSEIANITGSLIQTQMQTDAQRDVAEMQTGATERGQDIQKAIAEGRLELDRDTYENINLPQAAATLELTEKQTEKMINEIATSDKDFVVYMKQLSMGADNMLVEYFQRHHGINLANPESFTSLSFEKRQSLITAMIGLNATTARELRGLKGLVPDTGIVDLFNRGIDAVTGAIPSLGGGNLPPSESKQVKGRRGIGAR